METTTEIVTTTASNVEWAPDGSFVVGVALIVAIIGGLTELTTRLLSRWIVNVDDFKPLFAVLWGVVFGAVSFYLGIPNVESLLKGVVFGVAWGLLTTGLLQGVVGRSLNQGIFARFKSSR